MMTIYLVTDGTYSNYQINGVYSTREKAEAAQRVHNADRIEEWEIDRDFDLVESGLRYWSVRFGGQSADSDYVSGGGLERHDVPEIEETPSHLFVRNVLAKDKRSAVKIANEKRAIYLANKMEGD